MNYINNNAVIFYRIVINIILVVYVMNVKQIINYTIQNVV